jgi:integrase
VSKRAHGEGGLYRRSNGSWECRITDPETGKRRSFYAATDKAAVAKARKAQERLKTGGPVKDSTRTIGDWLATWRTTTLAVSDRKESTRSLYATLSRKHLEPAPFGVIRLDKLKATDIEKLILDLKARLADSTVRSIYVVIRAALDTAVRDALLARNPAALVARPGVKRTEARHLNHDEVSMLLKAAEGSRYHTALVLITSTGLRRGECLALRWDHVDLDAGLLRVEATISRIDGHLVISEPKTERARRTLPLSPALVTILKKHRTAQLEERMHAANVWQDHGLVFTTQLGTPVEPRSLLRVVEAAASHAGIEGVGAHTLRHSVATAWLESGVHIKAVSDLLGHSSISVTGDTYGHSSDSAARAAVEGFSDTLGI